LIGLILIVAIGLGAASYVLNAQHQTSNASPSSPGNTSQQPASPTTTSQPGPDELYQQCSTPVSDITFTDMSGNKATGSFCGYTVTGEDAAGNSAPAGYSFDNVVIYLTDNQSDRTASLTHFTWSLYLEFNVTSCAFLGPTSAAAGCSSFTGSNNEGLWMYSETGAIALEGDPVVIQPGPGQLFFVSVAVPTASTNSTGVYCVTGNNSDGSASGFTTGIGPELDTPLFNAP
jgi:hypothetical protein